MRNFFKISLTKTLTAAVHPQNLILCDLRNNTISPQFCTTHATFIIQYPAQGHCRSRGLNQQPCNWSSTSWATAAYKTFHSPLWFNQFQSSDKNIITIPIQKTMTELRESVHIFQMWYQVFLFCKSKICVPHCVALLHHFYVRSHKARLAVTLKSELAAYWDLQK